jgi:hypothetical protein
MVGARSPRRCFRGTAGSPPQRSATVQPGRQSTSAPSRSRDRVVVDVGSRYMSRRCRTSAGGRLPSHRTAPAWEENTGDSRGSTTRGVALSQWSCRCAVSRRLPRSRRPACSAWSRKPVARRPTSAWCRIGFLPHCRRPRSSLRVASALQACARDSPPQEQWSTAGRRNIQPCALASTTTALVGAEGVGFEPTMTVTSHSGFQERVINVRRHAP